MSGRRSLGLRPALGRARSGAVTGPRGERGTAPETAPGRQPGNHANPSLAGSGKAGQSPGPASMTTQPRHPAEANSVRLASKVPSGADVRRVLGMSNELDKQLRLRLAAWREGLAHGEAIHADDYDA